MNDKIRFRGIFPALITPLNDDSTVNSAMVPVLIKWMSESGVHGFYILGASGEGAVLSEKERMKMAEVASSAVKECQKKMIIHVGAADTQSAIRLARHAASVGANAISSVYPNFFNRYSIAEAVRYYQALIDASGLPMLGYCQSMMQEADVFQFVSELMKTDGVIGIKYTFPNYYVLQQLKTIDSGNINVLNGPDETLLCGLCMGADGGIGTTYNIMHQKYVEIYHAFLRNDVHTAQLLQHQANRVIAVVKKYGDVPSVKLVLEALGYRIGHAAFPGRVYSPEERKEVLEAFKEAGLFD